MRPHARIGAATAILPDGGPAGSSDQRPKSPGGRATASLPPAGRSGHSGRSDRIWPVSRFVNSRREAAPKGDGCWCAKFLSSWLCVVLPGGFLCRSCSAGEPAAVRCGGGVRRSAVAGRGRGALAGPTGSRGAGLRIIAPAREGPGRRAEGGRDAARRRSAPERERGGNSFEIMTSRHDYRKGEVGGPMLVRSVPASIPAFGSSIPAFGSVASAL